MRGRAGQGRAWQGMAGQGRAGCDAICDPPVRSTASWRRVQNTSPRHAKPRDAMCARDSKYVTIHSL